MAETRTRGTVKGREQVAADTAKAEEEQRLQLISAEKHHMEMARRLSALPEWKWFTEVLKNKCAQFKDAVMNAELKDDEIGKFREMRGAYQALNGLWEEPEAIAYALEQKLRAEGEFDE